MMILKYQNKPFLLNKDQSLEIIMGNKEKL